ncbi:MAG: tyrosine-type recombinase/integrase [Desulfuromusa sp.]
MSVKLNDKQIKSLLRKGVVGRYSAGNGLYLRISNEGTGFWAVRYTVNGRRREIMLGSYPGLTLANATIETAKLKLKVKQGIDPLIERKRVDSVKIKTVDDLAADWIKDCEKRLKYPNIPRRVYERDLQPIFGELLLEHITPLDIRDTLDKITDSGRPTISNDALMYCKQIFRHGIRLGVMNSNPADAFTVRHAGGIEKSRSRVLNPNELQKVFDCFREHIGKFKRENYLATALLIALGVRKGELIAAKWCEFDLDAALWKIPAARSKTGIAIVVPLSTLSVRWLQELQMRACGSEFIFPTRRFSKNNGHISPDTLNAAINKLFDGKDLTVDHFTVHDLRRTCRSLLAGVGVPSHIAERCLNHKVRGVEGIYDRYDYLDERREALQKVADLLEPIIDPV